MLYTFKCIVQYIVCKQNFLDFDTKNLQKLIEKNFNIKLEKDVYSTRQKLSDYGLINSYTQTDKESHLHAGKEILSEVEVTPLYLKIKHYIENETNEEFLDNFMEVYTHVTKEQLDYSISLINIDSKKNPTNEITATISLEDLQTIKEISFAICQLDLREINSRNYKSHRKAYQTLKEKALSKFDIILHNSDTPFMNPASMILKIDFILSKNDFTDEHKHNFWEYFILKNRIPYQKQVQDVLSHHNENQKIKKVTDMYYQLNDEEQSSFNYNENNFQTSARCYEIFKTKENIELMNIQIEASLPHPYDSWSAQDFQEILNDNEQAKQAKLKHANALFLYANPLELKNLLK